MINSWLFYSKVIFPRSCMVTHRVENKNSGNVQYGHFSWLNMGSPFL